MRTLAILTEPTAMGFRALNEQEFSALRQMVPDISTTEKIFVQRVNADSEHMGRLYKKDGEWLTYFGYWVTTNPNPNPKPTKGTEKMNHFTTENTENYSKQDLDILNEAYNLLIDANPAIKDPQAFADRLHNSYKIGLTAQELIAAANLSKFL